MKVDNIPKIIHYCWFGKGKKSKLARKCIKSWKEILADYKIIEWNEENFDIHINQYVEEAYFNKKYAFVSDYVRLYVLNIYGGIYMDTDVEVIKSFDGLLELKGFIGFEDIELVSTAIIGSEKQNILIKEWIDTYKNKHFIENGKMRTVTNVRNLTNIFLKYNLKQNNMRQGICNNSFTVYPIEYFSPLKIGRKKPKLTSNTICIHWFEGTWLSLNQRIKLFLVTFIKGILGFKIYNKIKSNLYD